MNRCHIFACPGDMAGQMLSCPPHWSLLSPDLRLELIASWDELVTERGVGNVRRATREHWRELVARADAQWAEVLERIAKAGEPDPGAAGLSWVRALRRITEREREQPSEGDVGPDDNLLDDHALWQARTGGGAS